MDFKNVSLKANNPTTYRKVPYPLTLNAKRHNAPFLNQVVSPGSKFVKFVS